MDKRKEYKPILKESHLTYDDYARLDDGNRYELVSGKLELMSPAPTVTHQMVSFELLKKIAHTCEMDYIVLPSPIDIILSSNEVRQPDIVLIHRMRLHIIKKHGILGPPDLVVEILSPSTRKRDKIDKLETYARYAIPEYWIVEPDIGVLEMFILREDKYELIDIFQEDDAVQSPTMPCISFTMAEIIQNIPSLDS